MLEKLASVFGNLQVSRTPQGGWLVRVNGQDFTSDTLDGASGQALKLAEQAATAEVALAEEKLIAAERALEAAREKAKLVGV